MKEDRLYLEHILQSVNRIIKYTKELSEKDFDTDDMAQDAVIRQLEIIGEATKRLSKEFRESNPSIP